VIAYRQHVKAYALCSVLLVLAVTAIPISVHAGGWVSVHVTGLLPTDMTCIISSPSSPNVIAPGSAACAIQVGTGIANGGFIIGVALPGSYVIQVTGNQGDFAQTLLSVA